MIIGIGSDLIDIRRMRALMDKARADATGARSA